MRVHELAKELGLASKDLIAEIKKLGGDAKNHMAVVEEKIIAQVRKKGGTTVAAAPAHPPQKSEAPKKLGVTPSEKPAVLLKVR